jgi:nucleotide-binding universal stress UspA family protein
MFKHLLVPLDGSTLSEAALPYASALAQKLEATVTLIHVIEHNAPEKIHGASHLNNAIDAEKYLSGVATRAFPQTVHVDHHVHTSEVSEVARSIVDHAGEFKPDLIVMCTHGESDLYQKIFGSIAQQIVTHGRTSLLLVPPPEVDAPLASGFRKILVPLDGDKDHEQGIEVAVDFAKVFHSELHLLVVIDTPETLTGEKAATSRMLPAMTAELLNISEQTALMYLHDQLVRLKPCGLTLTAEVARGKPSKEIGTVAKKTGAELVVLGTHGKSGIEAFWQGSVASKVSSRSIVPLLLVRLPA